jgi:hypothetical protein
MGGSDSKGLLTSGTIRFGFIILIGFMKSGFSGVRGGDGGGVRGSRAPVIYLNNRQNIDLILVNI